MGRAAGRLIVAAGVVVVPTGVLTWTGGLS